jgi:hypothetical protein
MENLEQALKALRITEETVLFVDVNQVNVKMLLNSETLPAGLRIVGVVGAPNVEAMTRDELQAILDRKPALSVEA